MKPRTKGVNAAILGHVEAIRAAADVSGIEECFQAAIRDLGFSDRRLKAVRAAMDERARELGTRHRLGALVPSFGPRRQLRVGSETYRVARGGNSAGIRYAWAYAENWATAAMCAQGLSPETAREVWGLWRSYPHRALRAIESMRAAA